jgi:hypothetical protein
MWFFVELANGSPTSQSSISFFVRLERVRLPKAGKIQLPRYPWQMSA